MPAYSSGFGTSIEDYQLFNLLGKGGFACVYRAKCRRTGIDVAIKMIDKGLMQAAGMVGRVQQEIKIHQRLKNPSVLDFYTCFEDKNYVYIVLELCHNGELQRYLKEQGPLSEQEAGRIIQQVVQGLLYLHSFQILHRDMSLSNLLLTKDMQVKIADFGLATQLSSPDEKHFTMCGTPNFIAPEVATRSSHGLETDVWSLGCMLYTLLVGTPPFDSNAVQSTLTRVVMADYKMPSHLSENAKNLIDRLLKKNPIDRIRLRDILKHPFITSIDKHGTNNKIGYGRFSGDNIDSGLGRTLSSNGHTRIRSRSEERSGAPVAYNGCSTRSDPTIDPIPSLHKSQSMRRSDYNRDNNTDSILSGINLPQQSGRSNSQILLSECEPPIRPTPVQRYDDYYDNNYTGEENLPSARLRNSYEDHKGRINNEPLYGINGVRSEVYNSGHINRNHSSHSGNSGHSGHSGYSGHNMEHNAGHYSSGARNVNHSGGLSGNYTANHNENYHDQNGPYMKENRIQNNVLEGYTNVLDGHGNAHREPFKNHEFRHTSERNSRSYERCNGHDSGYNRAISGHGSDHNHVKSSSNGIRIGTNSDERITGPNNAHREELYGGNSGGSNGSNGENHRRAPSRDRNGNSGSSKPKDNPIVSDEVASNKMKVPPLSTIRLQPTRHKTKSAILTILSSGEVVAEFLKKKNNLERIGEVWRVSGDGLRIIHYKPQEVVEPSQQPLPLPTRGADSMFSYENLPAKHQRKYDYAAEFVKLVRSQTPKITLYTSKAKCLYMENGPQPNCDTIFYDSIKVSQSKGIIKVKDKLGLTFSEAELPTELEEYYDHYIECYKRCQLLEASLTSLETATSQSFFPAIIGRKPVAPLNDSAAPLLGKENILRDPSIRPAIQQMPSFDATCSMVSTTLNVPAKNRHSNHFLESKPVKVDVPGIGTGVQMPSGDIRIDYKDGSVLTVITKKNGDGILFESSDGSIIHYNPRKDPKEMPDIVKKKLSQVPIVVQYLVEPIRPTPRSIR
ncbi:serine/threonine-protein kinase PLK4 [Trichogramma pretiosum]|uniref:serine/threonine-protein kinase PLK4 n=1 Tax=Trichogramma pretiosum TaxID=7493 RepID=UPI0006C98B34|nr:serine/threonine-protein kinase PLK4 [Trichogramma pretiosum]